VVLDAATRQFAAGGRAGTSVDDSAAEACVRKPAIYELFGSTDDLFRACVDQAVQALRDNSMPRSPCSLARSSATAYRAAVPRSSLRSSPRSIAPRGPIWNCT